MKVWIVHRGLSSDLQNHSQVTVGSLLLSVDYKAKRRVSQGIGWCGSVWGLGFFGLAGLKSGDVEFGVFAGRMLQAGERWAVRVHSSEVVSCIHTLYRFCNLWFRRLIWILGIRLWPS